MNAQIATPPPFDVLRLRADFPQLARRVHGRPLVYFDNANTAQKPRAVIDAVVEYYTDHNANVARAVHTLGAEATERYEGARDRIAGWINAPAREEVVLTSGTTMAINLVAHAWARPRLKPGDAIVVTMMEHHANIVPWQLACAATGAQLRVAPIDARGELDLEALAALLDGPVRLLALTHVSNVLGTINPVAAICAEARRRGVPVLVDGSQAAPHLPVDVQALGCDFYAFTGHKLYGPTGTGALWARAAHLEAMVPFHGGGEMIRTVSFDGSTWADPPYRFEAGTPNIAGFIGLAAAIDYVRSVGIEAIVAWEQVLLAHATQRFLAIPGLRLIGTAAHKVPVLSFVVDGAHAHDLATIIDTEGVAVRSGQHCAHPLIAHYGVSATARASLAFYNTLEEIDRCAGAIERARRMLA